MLTNIFNKNKKKIFQNYNQKDASLSLWQIVSHYMTTIYIRYENKWIKKIIDYKKKWEKKIKQKQTQHTNIVITPLGHSTIHIQIKNISILIDPIFDTPSIWFKRYTPAIEKKNVPSIDIILYSHNHPDHFDKKSLTMLYEKNNNIQIIAPLGFDEFLSENGFGHIPIILCDWWQSKTLLINNETILFHGLPAVHWSQYFLFQTNQTLWASWLIEYNNKKIYFAGDTAYGDHFIEISKKFKKIDIACLPIAPITPVSIQIESHISPMQAKNAFLELNKPMVIPIHWGTFAYGDEPLEEPIVQFKKYMKESGNLQYITSILPFKTTIL